MFQRANQGAGRICHGRFSIAPRASRRQSPVAPAGSVRGPGGTGTPAPDFRLNSTPDQALALCDFRGRPVVLVFYPADWSPVCGDQLALYNEILPEFSRHDAQVIGVSVDGVWCHAAYAQRPQAALPAAGRLRAQGGGRPEVRRLRRRQRRHLRARAVRHRRRRRRPLVLRFADGRQPRGRRHPARPGGAPQPEGSGP